MTGATVPYRANSDTLTLLRHKRRKENPKPKIVKRAYAGATLEHLTETDEGRDQYSYYHATKGWRTRRARGKTDYELRR